MLKIIKIFFVCVLFIPVCSQGAEQELRSTITEILSTPPFDVTKVSTSTSSIPSVAMGKEHEWARITSDYGKRPAPGGGGSTYHPGIDFGINKGTPLLAQGNGKIVYMNTESAYNKKKTTCESDTNCVWKCGSCKQKNNETQQCEGKQNSTTGISVVVCYGNGISIAYYHLSKHPAGLKIGTTVTPGQIIGYSGDTGAGCSGHLHYQVAYTPNDMDNCKGWNQPGNVIDPLCPFDFSTMPYYFKQGNKNNFRDEIMTDNARNNYESICKDWEHLDGENDQWLEIEETPETPEAPETPDYSSTSNYLWHGKTITKTDGF